MPLTVGELRKRLEGLQDDRWLYFYFGKDRLLLQAETTGVAPTDGWDAIVKLLDADLELSGSGTANERPLLSKRYYGEKG